MSDEENTIHLASNFSRNLAFRDTVKTLFNHINNSDLDEIIIDFQDVEFISRSFAHEILLNKRESKKKVILKNVAPRVQRMIDMVQSHKSYRS
ncbi:MAG: STAS-like domain-containing protein [Candidatus Hodarchaeales archaeon]